MTIERLGSRPSIASFLVAAESPARLADTGLNDAGPVSQSPLWASLSATEMALAELPNLERFRAYQRTVKQLLQSGLARVVVHQETYRSPYGRFQRMVYVSSIDRELEDLRQALLAEHIGTGILRHFDAIRGLLLDLFT
jgi:uncharacterized protein YaaR (DUF327 family)